MYREIENKKGASFASAAQNLSERGRGEERDEEYLPWEPYILSLLPPHRQSGTNNFAFKGNQARRGQLLPTPSRIEANTIPTEMETNRRQATWEGDRGTWSSHCTQENGGWWQAPRN